MKHVHYTTHPYAHPHTPHSHLYCIVYQVPVAIYYESLCPDSAKFITEQLYPAMKTELRDFVELTFVPFGKSQVSQWNNASFVTLAH